MATLKFNDKETLYGLSAVLDVDSIAYLFRQAVRMRVNLLSDTPYRHLLTYLGTLFMSKGVEDRAEILDKITDLTVPSKFSPHNGEYDIVPYYVQAMYVFLQPSIHDLDDIPF